MSKHLIFYHRMKKPEEKLETVAIVMSHIQLRINVIKDSKNSFHLLESGLMSRSQHTKESAICH